MPDGGERVWYATGVASRPDEILTVLMRPVWPDDKRGVIKIAVYVDAVKPHVAITVFATSRELALETWQSVRGRVGDDVEWWLPRDDGPRRGKSSTVNIWDARDDVRRKEHSDHSD